MTDNKQKKIMFSGGGTGGSVTPLLVVARILREKDANFDFVFVGTKNGPEKKLLSTYRMKGEPFYFIGIPAGKWRRYLSLKNLLDIFKIIFAFFISLKILAQEKPNLVFSAGGFVSVPLVLAAKIKNIPIIVHQQDVRAGLANRLMAPWATLITTTFLKSLDDYGPQAKWLGNPAPEKLSDDKLYELRKKYKLKDNKPILVISGGGTGSQAINDLVYKSVKKLEAQFQIIHITGRGKEPKDEILNDLNQYNDYHFFDIVASSTMFGFLQLADIVLARCGLATLTELATLGKVALLIPMPKTHQEDNAKVFAQAQAALYLEQETLNEESLIKAISDTYHDTNLKTTLSKNISTVIKPGAGEQMAQLALDLIARK